MLERPKHCINIFISAGETARNQTPSLRPCPKSCLDTGKSLLPCLFPQVQNRVLDYVASELWPEFKYKNAPLSSQHNWDLGAPTHTPTHLTPPSPWTGWASPAHAVPQ